jgi:hypothetical protein
MKCSKHGSGFGKEDRRWVYHFEGTLSAADAKKHLFHCFEVLSRSTSLDIRFHYTPGVVDGILNMLCLTLCDPIGFRGAGHRHGDLHEVHVSPSEATAGYQAGGLTPGLWTIGIDTHMIMPGEPCQYVLDVSLCVAENRVAEAREPTATSGTAFATSRGMGWYRGDLHTHSTHSDAQWAVAGLVEAAQQLGLDFVALTDHNTVSGLAEMDRASSAHLLTIGGMELTTYWGHALCLGTRQWIDWRVHPDTCGMAEIARKTYESDQVFVIAHPCAEGDPVCTGCDWAYPDVFPGPSQLAEIWSGSWLGDTHNERALALWYEWLNQGHRVVATAGTDAHNIRDLTDRRAFNVVYAEALTEVAILNALRNGHLYISAGPQLILTGQDGQGRQAMTGDVLSGEEAQMMLDWTDCPPGASLCLVVDSETVTKWPACESGRHTWTLDTNQARWCVVELRSSEGQMLAFTNPIFLRGHLPETTDSHDRSLTKGKNNATN